MKKIKVNADLYIGNDKLLTTAEATNMIESEINDYATEHPSYDDTEIRDLIHDVDNKIDTSGDGSKFLSDDGTYKLMGTDQINTVIEQAITDGRITNYDDTEIKHQLHDVENAVFDTFRGQNVLNITSVSSLDSGISVNYTNDMLTISGAKSAGGIIEIQTDTTIEPGTYYLSTDNGNFGVANYYATTIIVDNELNVVKRSDLVPNTGIEFSVSKTTNIKKIKLTYADSRNINFSGHVWINKDSKKEYDRFGEYTQSKVEKNTNELSKLDKKVDDINKKVIDIITPKKKTKILLSFDDARNVYTDGRYDLVRKTFGFPFTFCVSVNAENTIMAPPAEDINKMLFDGIDMGLYSSYGWDSFTNDDFNSNEVAIQNKWNDYVDNAVNKLQEYGYYNPVVWLCRHNKSGTALEKAVKRNHFKMIRGINVNHEYDTTYGYIPSFDKDVSITAEMYGVYSNNLDVALTRLNNAIKNGWDISLFTHKICADVSSASDVDSTVEVWTQLLTKIKEYVDAGKAECVTYSEYYRELYPVDCAELDKIRNYKMKYSN